MPFIGVFRKDILRTSRYLYHYKPLHFRKLKKAPYIHLDIRGDYSRCHPDSADKRPSGILTAATARRTGFYQSVGSWIRMMSLFSASTDLSGHHPIPLFGSKNSFSFI
ncbi:hypothetical protein ACFPFV_12130 [Salinicoccus siamensis]|uniref:hypothetical protein n=1 Tax=Salinicoccus siamensis TaxID=381830 RepID=UPI003609C682